MWKGAQKKLSPYRWGADGLALQDMLIETGVR